MGTCMAENTELPFHRRCRTCEKKCDEGAGQCDCCFMESLRQFPKGEKVMYQMNTTNEGTYCAMVRQRLHLTQAELADLLQVHRMTVSRWERGALVMDHAQLVVLRALYSGKLTVDDIRAKIPNKFPCNVPTGGEPPEQEPKTLENKG